MEFDYFRLMLKLLAAGLFLVAFGCSANGVLLIHPRTGGMVKCSAEHAGAVGAPTGAFLESCVKAAGERGYVPAGALSSEQRAELKRRGFVPLDALSPAQQSDAQRRGMLPRREQTSLP